MDSFQNQTLLSFLNLTAMGMARYVDAAFGLLKNSFGLF
jgi:hypothetical protein